MKTKELRALDEKDLKAKVTNLKEEIFWLKFKHSSGQMEKSANIQATKRDLARVLTILGEKARSASLNEEGK